MAKVKVCADGFQVPSKDEIKDKLASDRGWMERALVKLWERQTRDEQEWQITYHHNEVGFTGWDAQILTSFAERIMWYKLALSPRQIEVAAKRLPKYWRQIEDEIIQAHGGL